MDYYDQVNLYPDKAYTKLNGDYVVTKAIRLNQKEVANWDSKEIHAFLQNKNVAQFQNDNLIEKLKTGFLQYNSLFEKLTKTDITKENLKNLARENLDISLIKELLELTQ